MRLLQFLLRIFHMICFMFYAKLGYKYKQEFPFFNRVSVQMKMVESFLSSKSHMYGCGFASLLQLNGVMNTKAGLGNAISARFILSIVVW